MRAAWLLLSIPALVCAPAQAGERPPAAPAQGASPPSPPAQCQLVKGMDREAVRRCLGPPAKVQKQASSVLDDLVYEKWTYPAAPGKNEPAREVWFADGRVVDVT